MSRLLTRLPPMKTGNVKRNRPIPARMSRPQRRRTFPIRSRMPMHSFLVNLAIMLRQQMATSGASDDEPAPALLHADVRCSNANTEASAVCANTNRTGRAITNSKGPVHATSPSAKRFLISFREFANPLPSSGRVAEVMGSRVIAESSSSENAAVSHRDAMCDHETIRCKSSQSYYQSSLPVAHRTLGPVFEQRLTSLRIVGSSYPMQLLEVARQSGAIRTEHTRQAAQNRFVKRHGLVRDD